MTPDESVGWYMDTAIEPLSGGSFIAPAVTDRTDAGRKVCENFLAGLGWEAGRASILNEWSSCQETHYLSNLFTIKCYAKSIVGIPSLEALSNDRNLVFNEIKMLDYHAYDDDDDDDEDD